MSELLEKLLFYVQNVFDNVDNIFNECKNLQDYIQNLVKSSATNNDKNIAQEIDSKHRIWVEKMANLHKLLIEAVNRVSRLIKTYSKTNEYYHGLQVIQIANSRLAPFDRIDVCFEKYTQFINMMQIFKLQNAEIYERRLSNGATFEINKKFIAYIFDFVQQFLADFIYKFIIVTKQPPFCILRDSTAKNSDDQNLRNVTNKLDPSKEMPKCQKAFDLEVKMYSLSNVTDFVRFHNGKESVKPIVKAGIVGEDDYIKWMKGGNAPAQMGSLSETKPTHFELKDRVWTAKFNNMRIIKITRQVAERKKKIEEMRFCIMFGIKIGSISLPGWNGSINLTNQAVSLPFVLVSNPVQRKAAFPCVCWCRTFNQMENFEIDFQNDKREIPWSNFKYCLNDIFRTATNCEPLKDFQLYHLGELLFQKESFDATDRHAVTFQKFLNISLSSSNDSVLFYDWYYSTIDFIGNKKIKPYWTVNLICGFMSRETAEFILKQQSVSSMLIRFSDSVIGSLVFSVILPELDNEVMHMIVEESLCNEYNSLYQLYEGLCEKYEHMKQIKVIISGPDQFELMEKFKNIQFNKKIEKETDKINATEKFRKYFKIDKNLILKEGAGGKIMNEILMIIKSKRFPSANYSEASSSSLEDHMNNFDIRTFSNDSASFSGNASFIFDEFDWSTINKFLDNDLTGDDGPDSTNSDSPIDQHMFDDGYTPNNFNFFRTQSTDAEAVDEFFRFNDDQQLPELRPYVDQYLYKPENCTVPQNDFSSL